MQTLRRRLAPVEEPSTSSSDAHSTKKPRPFGQSPFLQWSTQGLYSRASSTKSLRSLSDAPPGAALPIPKTILRSISRTSSRLGLREHQTEEDEMPARRNEEASEGHGTGLANRVGPKTRIKHVRNRTEVDVHPDPTMHMRPSTSPCTSFDRSSRSDLTVPCPRRRSLDLSTLVVPGDQSVANSQQPLLTRTTTGTSIASQTSEDTDIMFAPTNYHWQPPTSWAGPSPAEQDKPKLGRWFTKKKEVKGSSGVSGMRVYSRLNSTYSLRKLKPVLLVTKGGPREERDSVTQGEPRLSGAIVKIQSYEGDGHWHEKPMADIIPKLRELRLK